MLILASTSKYRAELLTKLGFPFTQEAPGVDEDVFKKKGTHPARLAEILAREKALAVATRNPKACVIGSDQVCVLGNKELSKPGSFEKAFEQLKFMSGKTHELLTAVCLISPQGKIEFLNRTVLTMRPLTDQEITTYLKTDHPYDCAGSYKLESFGISLFDDIQMSDHTAIVGLPLIELHKHLLNLGYTHD